MNTYSSRAAWISRRQALSLFGAAVGAAALPHRGWAQSIEWDVIVVGAGTAGLPAALFAARRGARVLLLEKAGQIGGTLWLSTGQMSAAGTRLQKEMGIDDSPQRHLQDIMRISNATANRDLVSRAVEGAAATLDWLEACGIAFKPHSPVASTGHEPYSERRIWEGVDSGRSIIEILQREIATVSQNARILNQTEVIALEQDRDGQVRGVRARTGTGEELAFRAGNVVLASGGYMANPELFQELNGVPMYKRGATWPMNTGIGVELARAAGGYIRGKENYLCDFGQVPQDPGVPSAAVASIVTGSRRQPWELWVNAVGERFVREDEPSPHVRESSLVRQPGHRYWVVFDEQALRNAPTLVRAASYVNSRDWNGKELQQAFGKLKAFSKGGSLRELAEKAVIDPSGLERSVLAYNKAIDLGRADPFSRQFRPRSIDTPPFYAIQVQGGSLISMAGVAVDTSLRVIRRDGSPIPNLFAAGEMLGNCVLSGQAFCGGMMVTPALTFGRLIGEQSIRLRT